MKHGFSTIVFPTKAVVNAFAFLEFAALEKLDILIFFFYNFTNVVQILLLILLVHIYVKDIYAFPSLVIVFHLISSKNFEDPSYIII